MQQRGRGRGTIHQWMRGVAAALLAVSLMGCGGGKDLVNPLGAESAEGVKQSHILGDIGHYPGPGGTSAVVGTPSRMSFEGERGGRRGDRRGGRRGGRDRGGKGKLLVTSVPPNARIFLNGTDTGRRTRTRLKNLEPGSYLVRLLLEGFLPFETTVNVVARRTARVTAELQQPPSAPSFAAQLQPLFTATCAFEGCHAGENPRQGLNLSAGQAYNNIVNVASREVSSLMRIKPGDPENSYLIHKLRGTQASVGGFGGRMPLGGQPWSNEQIELLRQWVQQGAPNN